MKESSSNSGMIGSLIDLLRGQTEIYSDMLDLSLQKKDIIVKNDVEALKKVTGKENGLLGRSQRLEKQRAELMVDISAVLNKKADDITIEVLTQMLKDRPETATEAEAIEQSARELRLVLGQLKEKNEINRMLIQNSLEYIDFSINVIRSTVGEEISYTSPYGEGFNIDSSFYDTKQ